MFEIITGETLLLYTQTIIVLLGNIEVRIIIMYYSHMFSYNTFARNVANLLAQHSRACSIRGGSAYKAANLKQMSFIASYIVVDVTNAHVLLCLACQGAD